jgi:uncharacterized membrane protein YdjX (TVP38/TMEM64 family)
MLQHIEQLRRGHGMLWFTVVFVAIYAVATSLGLPGMPFTAASGVLFGTPVGVAASWAGAMIGAVIGYWLARTIGHDVVARWIKRFRRGAAALHEASGFGGMLRLRLVPVIPMAMVSYAGGLARVPLLQYLAATAIGVLPSTIVYVYFADALVGGLTSPGGTGALTSLIVASALLLVISLAPRLIRGRG